ncbi:two-partner secretion domain-containing protein [Anaerosinus massiliensis]|uniref:two-partner secretion domain-containing protein n=1 Tax=Massilibacillus massiliensis TaxID=1806837 RepID=UPI000B17F327|nr:hemagglutinin repeat-containing protein [Massilibacillus massiliensis]
MKKKLKVCCKKIIASAVLMTFTLQPLTVFANVVADPNANSTQKPGINEINQTPVIDIAAPNSNGLSHNLYTDFNVTANGVILNNATQLAKTTLAGDVQANANLNGLAASIILNEVTGTNRTNLNGMLEVAGNRASVIIANPNGITGNGFGFINTNRVTLVTGTPNLDATGGLNSFNVSSGDIAIEGGGIGEDTPMTKLDILTRAAKINAEVWADEINIVTGNNKIDYQTLSTENIPENAAQKPVVALDVGAVGGMYAGKIMVVGTEEGLGVNLAGDVSANKNLSLTNAGKIVVNGNISAKEVLTITAGDDFVNNGQISSNQDIHIKAQNITNTGFISAGEEDEDEDEDGNATNTKTVPADFTADAMEKIDITGVISASNTITLAGKKVAYEASNAIAENIIVNQSEPDPTVEEPQKPLPEDITKPLLPDIPDYAQSATTDAVSKPESLALTADQKASGVYKPIIDKTASGIDLVQIATPNAKGISRNLYTDFNIKSSGLILNNATKYAKTQLGGYVDYNNRLGGISAKVILNEITSTNPSQLNGFIEVAGDKASIVIANPNGMTINGFGYINTNNAALSTGIISRWENGNVEFYPMANGDILLQGDGLNASKTNTITILAKAFTNTASELWAQDLMLTSNGDLINTGKIVADGQMTLKNKNLDNKENALLYSGKDMTLDTKENIRNKNAGIEAKGNSRIRAQNLGNQEDAGIFIGGDLDLSVEQLLANQQSVIAANGKADVIAKNINNVENAVVYSTNDLKITAANRILNQSSDIESQGSVTLAANQLINEKEIFETYWDITHQTISYGITPRPDHYSATRRFAREIKTGTIQKETTDAQILADKDITINAENVTNHYSTIAAGHDLTIDAPYIENFGYQGTIITTDVGNDTHNWKYKHHGKWHRHCHMVYGTTVIPYYNQTIVDEPISRPGVLSGVNKVKITAKIIDNRTFNAGKNVIQNKVEDLTEPNVLNQLRGKRQDELAIGSLAINSKLFNINHNPTAKYLIETNGKFADYKSFLSSDYLLERVKADPEKVAKRLGDGYYEQKLVTEQITELTGRRFLNDYSSALEQYKALMEDGAAFAKDYNLTVGVALTKEQMAALTSDIVWLVEEEINGEKVLVPEVYLAALKPGDLKNSGALITGTDVELVASDDLKNIGTIKADKSLTVTAGNITNENGTLTGSDVNLTAKENLDNRSANITGDNVTITAGNIINQTNTKNESYRELNQTKTLDTANITAKNNLTLTAENSIKNQGANLTAGKELVLTAKKDIDLETVAKERHVAVVYNKSSAEENKIEHRQGNVTGQNITIHGDNVNIQGTNIVADDTVNITGKSDVNISAVKNSDESDGTVGSRGGEYFRRQKNNDETILNASIAAGKDITIKTGKDINVKGSNISSEEGKVTLTGKDVNLLNETEHHESLREEHTERKGFFSSTKTDIYDYQATDAVVGSSISGGQIKADADQDIHIKGSTAVADKDVELTAKGNINIESAEQTSEDLYKKSVKKSGLFSGGGLGITIGKQSQKDSQANQTIEQIGATVGSLEGNVDIKAGKDANVKASDVIAGKDINITGENIAIESADNTYNSQEKHEFKQSGLTIALESQTINTYQKVYDSVERATQVSDDRLKALYAYKADEDYKAVKAAEDKAAKLKAEQEAKTKVETQNNNNGDPTNQTGNQDQPKKPAQKSDISISVSLGTSKSESNATSHTTVAQGSSITGGDNVKVKSTKGDIKVKGSDISGENVTLDASENIEIIASENKNTSNTDSKSSSASIGASINLGDGSIGGINISGSKQKGEIKENSTTYNQSTVTADDNLTMKSGKDIDVIGSKASGDKVKVEAGENLNLESLQDQETYDEKNSSVGGTIGVGTFNASASKGKINSDYESVTKQAEIHAGKGGFDIEIGKNTDLKGAVISSDATPDKNKISTDTLTYSDIDNKADYGASSKGVNYSNGGDTKYNEQGFTPNASTPANGEASSTTKSAVAEGTIEVRSNPNQDLSGLSRDTSKALNELGKIFDKKKIQEQQELADLFGKLAFEEVHKISEAHGWDEGSPQKIALHAFVGGIMTEITGNGFKSGAVGAGVNEAVQKELEKYFKNQPDMWQWASALIGSAAAKAVGGNAQAGGSVAASGTKNNNLYESVARTAIRIGVLPNPENMQNDYVYVELSGDLPFVGSLGGGYIMDKNGELYRFSEKGWSLGLPIPLVGAAGVGNVDTTWKDGGGNIRDAIEGMSASGGGSSLVSANVSVATNGALTFEVGFETSAGVTFATRDAEWVGSIYQDN